MFVHLESGEITGDSDMDITRYTRMLGNNGQRRKNNSNGNDSNNDDVVELDRELERKLMLFRRTDECCNGDHDDGEGVSIRS